MSDNTTHTTNARDRVLDAAEALFAEDGYKAATMQDIADTLDIRQASLYYHFPEGKEQLFVAVAERRFERHRAGIEAALDEAGSDLRAQMHAVGHWFSSHPPIHLLGMMHADMPALSEANREHLMDTAYRCIFTPIRQMFVDAQERGEVRDINPNLLTGSFLALIDGVSFAGETLPGAPSRPVMANVIVSLLLDGILPR